MYIVCRRKCHQQFLIWCQNVEVCEQSKSFPCICLYMFVLAAWTAPGRSLNANQTDTGIPTIPISGHHMATEIWVNIVSGNGLLPDGTKPLPEPMLTFYHLSPVTFILGQFYKRCLNHQSLKSVWKLYLKFYWNSPGCNELISTYKKKQIDRISCNWWTIYGCCTANMCMQQLGPFY